MKIKKIIIKSGCALYYFFSYIATYANPNLTSSGMPIHPNIFLYNCWSAQGSVQTMISLAEIEIMAKLWNGDPRNQG